MTSREASTLKPRVQAFFKQVESANRWRVQDPRSVQLRGTALAAEQLSRTGVTAYSSDHHASVPWRSRLTPAGARATLVMPLDAPRNKVEATRATGARIVTYDRFVEDRTAIGKRIAEETGAALVPPFDHPWIIAGQGTTALELLEEIPDLDAAVVPAGGGGLILRTLDRRRRGCVRRFA